MRICLRWRGAPRPRPFNWRGVEVTDLEVFDAVRRAAGVTVEPNFVETRAGEAERVSLDSSKAASLLGWKPRSDRDGSRCGAHPPSPAAKTRLGAGFYFIDSAPWL